MSYTNITSATTTQVATGAVSKVKLQFNSTSAGAVTVIDNTAGSTPVVATIAAPTLGQTYEYWDFKTGVRITTAGTPDLTVNCSSTYGPK